MGGSEPILGARPGATFRATPLAIHDVLSNSACDNPADRRPEAPPGCSGPFRKFGTSEGPLVLPTV